MTQREIVVRLAEAYIKAGATVEADKIIKIADYFMAHTNDSSYNTGASWIEAINKGYVRSALYGTADEGRLTAYSASTNECLNAEINTTSASSELMDIVTL